MLIHRVWRTQPGDYFCLSTKGKKGWRDHFFTREELEDIEEFIADHEESDDLYWCPHSFLMQSRRSEYYARPSKMLWADLDAVDPTTLDLRPTMAWQTSPGRFAAIWLLDGEPRRGLRRAFNQAIGADGGGWCITKVLRIPGTRNWKYANAPRGKVLWEHGPTYSLEAVARQYPVPNSAPQPLHRKGSSLEARTILDKYGVRGWLRQELLRGGQVGNERRHRMHWRLACELHGKGIPKDEAFVCLRDTAWNKHQFENKDDPDKWVWQLVDKVWK
jgi:hypothetical protein